MLRIATRIIACVSVVWVAPAFAQDYAKTDQIMAAIAGNTVTGSMTASGAYAEFYAPDGTIRSADYSGSWSIAEDQMCFAYGQDPATCWTVQLDGDKVFWLGVDGVLEGSGTIVAGNPNGW